uniref:GIR1-like zinc ribbon domain-containing protein n=1 Tax=Rhizophora mucronata TaxID=61149 RepID=A0A2P2IVK4_RHIMU
MAADVSTLVRILNGYKDDRTVVNEPDGGKSTALITMDLLGSSAGVTKNQSQELDLDLQVPTGWEKRLDLKSGKVYLQRRSPPNSLSSSSLDHRQHQSSETVPKFQDLNFPPSPPSSKVTLNLFDDSNLELKLVSSSSLSSSSGNYQSVCTLDRVKSALERAEKEPIRKRSVLWKSSLSPSYSSSSSSMKEIQEEENDQEKAVPSPVAAGCPGCLSYVLIMKNNPKCPRCNSVVPMPMTKKPRIDLNVSI